MTLEFATAIQLAQKIREKEISSRELTDHYIERIERLDGDVNAVVVRDFDRARDAADASDRALASGQDLGPLHGVPMTIKEAYDIEGLATTWGAPDFEQNIAKSDSDTVAKFKAAGAHFLGKTNVPIFLGDFQSYNKIYGTTNNPWDLERIPGGSSGGSAAALAAGLSALEAGSDIGGSIRNPAHFCGIYGHKPTWNIVPQQGHSLPGMHATPDIAVVGPMARSAEDLALSLEVAAGPEPLLAPGWKLDLPKPRHKKLSDYRVALWPSDSQAPVSTEISDRVQRVGDRLAKLGAKVSDTARPDMDPAASHEVYIYMLYGVMAAELDEQVLSEWSSQIADSGPGDRSEEVTIARAATQSHLDWTRYDHERGRLREIWRDFHSDWDILICPQMATPAFKHDHRPFSDRSVLVDGVSQPYMKQIFWSGLITVGYRPSTVFPTGASESGLPIGLQAAGAEYDDYTCIDFARLVTEEMGGFVPPPGY